MKSMVVRSSARMILGATWCWRITAPLPILWEEPRNSSDWNLLIHCAAVSGSNVSLPTTIWAANGIRQYPSLGAEFNLASSKEYFLRYYDSPRTEGHCSIRLKTSVSSRTLTDCSAMKRYRRYVIRS